MNGTQRPHLSLWKDIDPRPRPLIKPSSTNANHVLIIGGGVTALVTAWVLLDSGYQVTLISKAWASPSDRLTSQIAGALWEFPPAVCGKHSDNAPLHHFKDWSMTGYHIFQGLALDPLVGKEFGVKMVRSTFFFRSPLEELSEEHEKMLEIMASGVRGFKRGLDIIKEHGIEEAAGVVDAYEHLAPVIDTDAAMRYLMNMVKGKGAMFVAETITKDLIEIEKDLLARFSADAIVNATGLGSGVVAGDNTVFPIRGALIRVVNNGTDFPKITASITAPSRHGNPNEFIFLVPRTDNVLIMGGISEANQWKLDLTLESPQIVKIREMCEDFMPALKNARLVEDYPLAQGLRPFRAADTRLERDPRQPDTRIIHSYAQGGSGWSWSFGCAHETLELVEEILNEVEGCEKARAQGAKEPLIMFGDAWE